MLNGTDWQTTHPEFIGDAQRLLSRCQECFAHLQLIADDSDALECLLDSLSRLSQQAAHARIGCMAVLCQDMRRPLDIALPNQRLNDETLAVLEKCLTLLAWQLELIDLRTGLLPLDDGEQTWLLAQLAVTCEPDNRQHTPVPGLAVAQAPR